MIFLMVNKGTITDAYLTRTHVCTLENGQKMVLAPSTRVQVEMATGRAWYGAKPIYLNYYEFGLVN